MVNITAFVAHTAKDFIKSYVRSSGVTITSIVVVLFVVGTVIKAFTMVEVMARIVEVAIATASFAMATYTLFRIIMIVILAATMAASEKITMAVEIQLAYSFKTSVLINMVLAGAKALTMAYNFSFHSEEPLFIAMEKSMCTVMTTASMKTRLTAIIAMKHFITGKIELAKANIIELMVVCITIDRAFATGTAVLD